MNYNDLEKFRLECKNKVKRIAKKYICFLVICTCLLFVFAMLTRSSNPVSIRTRSFTLLETVSPMVFVTIYCFIISIPIIVIICFVSLSKERENYKKAYKAYFVSDVLSKTFGKYSFNHEKGIDLFEIQKIGMMYTGNEFNSNDLVIGTYKDVEFRQSDVNIIKVTTDSDGHKNRTIIFRGRWLIFDFKKDLDKKLAVVGESFSGCIVTKREGYKKLDLESSDFNNHFNVYAQDGFEAYYVLDPAFMERATALAKRYNDKVYLAFADGKLHIGINDNKDSFEPPSFMKQINEEKEKEKVSEEVKLITNIIDELKLENKC